MKKVDITGVPNNYVYLHKAIRMRDPYLTQQFINLGVDVNAVDDQGILKLTQRCHMSTCITKRVY
jgi:hypothetical protein